MQDGNFLLQILWYYYLFLKMQNLLLLLTEDSDMLFVIIRVAS